VREIRMLRSTWRGLETWHGRDGVTLANERARQQGTQTSTYTGAPVLDPTDERNVETESRLNHSGTARRKGRQQICSTYSHRATFRLYHNPNLPPLGSCQLRRVGPGNCTPSLSVG